MMTDSTNNATEDITKECFLINAGILNFTDIEKNDSLLIDVDVTILNLHCNKLSSLKGLPTFELLTEINLSSNEFRDVNVSELVHLPNLRSLDMSGNYINKLDNLPYLPSLETFSVAFNNISSLNGLDGFPVLQTLDIRGNSLATVDAFSSIQVLSYLRNIQLCSPDGRHANPICGQEAELISVFDSFFYLGTIDQKNRQDYANILTEKTFGFMESSQPPEAATHPLQQHHSDLRDHSTVIDNHEQQLSTGRERELTPKFDKAVERFRHRLQEGNAPATAVQTHLADNSVVSASESGTIGGVVVYEDDDSDGDNESVALAGNEDGSMNIRYVGFSRHFF
jgi:hypothetical protein